MKKIFSIINLVLLYCIAYAQTDNVTLKFTEEFTLDSKEVNDTLYVQVSLPNSYKNSDKEYPIIYLLDSDPSFGLVKGITWWLNFEQIIPEVIIIGVAYKNDWWQKRSRDYTPTKDRANNWGDWPSAGGADNFIEFIVNELNPAIKKYRIDWTNKSVIGHSFGGLFTTYVLLTKPEIFDNYISVNPALIWNNNYLWTLSLDKLQNRKSNTFVFTAIGEFDDKKINEPWEAFNKYIEQKEIKNLNWRTEYYPNQTHSSVLPIAISDGLRMIYRD